jgi:hypothetical protein
MSKTQLNVLFKKIQKDDKKEVLEFHVQGDELPNSQELVSLAGSIVSLEVDESEAIAFNAEFKSIQRDSKKTALKFNVTGKSDDKMIKLYPFAGSGVTIILSPSQMSIDEFYDREDDEEDEEESDFVAQADQLSLDDIQEEEEDIPFTDTDSESDLLN